MGRAQGRVRFLRLPPPSDRQPALPRGAPDVPLPTKRGSSVLPCVVVSLSAAPTGLSAPSDSCLRSFIHLQGPWQLWVLDR